jgi:hypothetical protein
MRLRPHQAALAALNQVETTEYEEAAPFSKESAIRFLELFTNQHFGCDVSAWSSWFSSKREDELDHLYAILDTKSSTRR